MRRRLIIIGIALGLSLTASCGWPVHAREVEQLQLIQTLGYDVQPGGVTVSASSGPQPGGGAPVRLAARGGSIPEAVQALQHWSAREELLFSHVRFVLMGEAAARRGAAPLLDYFQRTSQTPMNLPLLVVKGGSARDLTESGDPDYEITALLASLREDSQRTGAPRCFTMLDTARRLSRSGAALCCAVELLPPGENVPSAEEDALCAVPAGYAVLKEGKLAGYLDTETALGADLLLGISGPAVLTLPAGAGAVTVALREAKTVLTPRWEPEPGLVLAAELRVSAGILQAEGADPADPRTLRDVDAALSRALQTRAEAALAASRETGADFLELGALFALRGGGLPRPSSPEALLSALTWQVRVDAAAERSYDLEGTVPVAGGEAEP